jgi:hypothetical protein
METLGSLYQAALQETKPTAAHKLSRQTKAIRHEDQPLFWIMP